MSPLYSNSNNRGLGCHRSETSTFCAILPNRTILNILPFIFKIMISSFSVVCTAPVPWTELYLRLSLALTPVPTTQRQSPSVTVTPARSAPTATTPTHTRRTRGDIIAFTHAFPCCAFSLPQTNRFIAPKSRDVLHSMVQNVCHNSRLF